MRSRQLETAVEQFLQEAAAYLRGELAAGAEVQFELDTRAASRGRSATPLYCYRALPGAFIAERESALARQPGYAELAKLLEDFDGLERYLESAGVDVARMSVRARARAAVKVLLEDIFEEQSGFEIRAPRVVEALERLERSALAGAGDVTLVATLHGLAIASPELPLTKGLKIVRPSAVEGMPQGAVAGAAMGRAKDHLLVVLTLADDGDDEDGSAIAPGGGPGAIEQGREVLKDLLRALRLFGDGRVTLGGLAWARIDAGSWNPFSLGGGGDPHGMLVVTADQEDELRAFCNLVSRRAPEGNELAWALRRFELGCERDSPFEGLSDHLLALRVLLEPEGSSSGLFAGRVAALCAAPEERVALTERMVRAISLERAAITGGSVKHAGGQTLAREVSAHLRALLRDVICGHLAPDLVSLADELLAGPGSADAGAEGERETDSGVESELLGPATGELLVTS
jgi:hypothetical protein